jgi:hypothetical protein
MDKATEWEAKDRETALAEAEPLTLPSGMVILARRPDPVQLVAWNKLPLILAGAAGGDTGTTAAAPTDEQQMVEVAGFYRDLLVYCCVDPQVSLVPGPGKILPVKIPKQDWTFIVNWAMRSREAAALRSFRDGRTDGGGGGDGEGVWSPAVEPAGDRGLHAVLGVRPRGRGEAAEGTGGVQE